MTRPGFPKGAGPLGAGLGGSPCLFRGLDAP